MTSLCRAAVLLVVAVLALSGCSDGGDDSAPTGEPGATTVPQQGARGTAPVLQDLMAKASMTERARQIFLATSPQVEAKADVQRNCKETGHVLGCLQVTRECRSLGNRAPSCATTMKMHLLRIDQADVSDLMFVASAHEMLHAAYEQIPQPQRQRLDGQLRAASAGLDQCRVSSALAPYSGRPQEDQVDELHSRLGTEFPRLPPTLEAHYSQYFVDRQALVRANDRAMGGREQEICTLSARLDQLKTEINAARGRASRSLGAYNLRINGLIREYNRVVGQHNQKVREYNRLLNNLGASADVLGERPPEEPAPEVPQ